MHERRGINHALRLKFPINVNCWSLPRRCVVRLLFRVRSIEAQIDNFESVLLAKSPHAEEIKKLGGREAEDSQDVLSSICRTLFYNLFDDFIIPLILPEILLSWTMPRGRLKFPGNCRWRLKRRDNIFSEAFRFLLFRHMALLMSVPD